MTENQAHQKANEKTKRPIPCFGLRCPKKPPPPRYKTDPADIAKGKLILDVLESNDPIQMVNDRLKLWPEGNEILSLLMVLKSEQINESWMPAAVEPAPSLPSVSITPVRSSKSSPGRKESKRKSAHS